MKIHTLAKRLQVILSDRAKTTMDNLKVIEKLMLGNQEKINKMTQKMRKFNEQINLSSRICRRYLGYAINMQYQRIEKDEIIEAVYEQAENLVDQEERYNDIYKNFSQLLGNDNTDFLDEMVEYIDTILIQNNFFATYIDDLRNTCDFELLTARKTKLM